MELHQLRYFLALVREESFTRAAASCNVTQPALTRAIQKLEEEMGGLLFDRRPGRIELTELGRRLQPRFEAAVKQVSDARTDAKSLLEARRRRLRLGLTCTLGPARLIGLIRMLHDTIDDLELILREGKAPDVIDMMVRDEVDAGIVGLPSYSDQFEITPLYRERYVVAMSKSHRLLAQPTVKLDDLEGESYLDRLHCEFDDHFTAQHGDWTVGIETRFQSEREDWIQSLVAAGLGVSIVPEYQGLLPEIETRPLIEPETYRDVAIATLKNKTQSAPIAELISIAGVFDWTGKAGS